jgi:ribosome-associated protein
LRPNKIQKAAIDALEDIKATDITPLDTRTLTSLYDALVIATAESARQTKALARHVADKVREAGGRVTAIEGEESGEWVIVDCGDLVVHIMLPQTRMLYNLEELWTPSPAKTGRRVPKTTDKKTNFSSPIAQKNGARTRSAGTVSAKSASKTTRPPAAKGSAKKPAAKRPVAKKPAAKRPAAKKPAAKKPAAKKPAVRKPASKKPAAKKPAAKKRR